MSTSTLLALAICRQSDKLARSTLNLSVIIHDDTVWATLYTTREGTELRYYSKINNNNNMKPYYLFIITFNLNLGIS